MSNHDPAVPPLFGSSSISRQQIVQRILAHPLGEQAAEQRRNFARLMLGGVAEHGRARRRELHWAGQDGSIVYFHGGGYAFGSPQTHARLGQALARRTGLQVLLPAYPLAPEQRWPAQLDAALDAVQTLAQQPGAGPIVLAGDSAGGHLALVTALELARRGQALAGLLLFSPNTDRSGLSDTRQRSQAEDPMVDEAGDRRLARQCLGDLPDRHPQASPVLDDLTLLPPLYIEAGAGEVLLGDSLILAQRARGAGRAVTLHVQPDGLHMGQLWAPWWPVAQASLMRAQAFCRSVVALAASESPDSPAPLA
ncbi:alpha/beta hydrolase [Melaminivora suipulveris]|uniref:Alpha/beta hydrolase n=1 Tax=Melaminivora suipulveris TaxID=2109913 RepID=A0A2R3QG57_9BURK|nr:alpha/beta hydrolase fold domain-containing protein [Melaminivora suipulveris]AVO50749.1 alpha/beta hydrolase [Melaminivora suipulveris]